MPDTIIIFIFVPGGLFILGFLLYLYITYIKKKTEPERRTRRVVYDFSIERCMERERYTDEDVLIVANTPLEAVRDSIKANFPVVAHLPIPISGSFSDTTIFDAKYELLADTPSRLEYKSWVEFAIDGDWNEFQVHIDLENLGTESTGVEEGTRVEATIAPRREHDGSARHEDIEAMDGFHDEILAAVRSVDPDATELCTWCLAPFEPGMRFCSHCGMPVRNESPQPQALIR